MATTTLERELLGLERKFWQALKDGDVDTAVKLTDDPCILTGAQGVNQIDRRTFRKMMKEAEYTLDDFTISDQVEVLLLDDDTAILAYTVHEDLTVEGKPVSLDAADASTWVRRDGSWLCALHTESIAGDPFGRDRKAPKKR